MRNNNRMSRKVAIVPVKKKSDRVANKNFKIFADNLSLLEFKIKQIISSNCFDEVYISSNSQEALLLANKYKISHIMRDDYYCSNEVSWSDVIFEVVNSIPENNDAIISWCHTTSPLFTRYKEALEKFIKISTEESEYDGLTTVNNFAEFILTSNSRPLNYNWGIWHDYSQHMEKLFRVTGALFVTTKAEMLKNRYVMSKRPFLFITNSVEGIDVDTEYDFKLAQLIYQNQELFNYAF